MIIRPLTRPLTSPPARGITDAWVGGLSAFSAAKFAIEQDSADVNILVIGDSTGNETTEWVYLFGQWLATQYPTHSVSYRLWNDAGDVYDAAVALGTGSGANTIRIWNASVAGVKPSYLMGSKYAAAVEAISPTLVLWNHGHNLTTLTDFVLRGELIGPMEQVRLSKPTAVHAMIIQNPRRDDELYTQIASAIQEVCQDRLDTPSVDVHSRFLAQSKSASLYVDSIHPSAEGTQLYLAALQSNWGVRAGVYETLPAWLKTAGTNIAANGDFAAFAGAVPDGWTLSGDGTVSKELAIVAPGSSYSVKLVNGATKTILLQNIAATEYRGQTLTLAVRMYVDAAGADANTGQVRLFANGTGVVLQANRPGASGTGGWKWVVVSAPVVADATTVGPYLYASAADGGTSTIYLDRAILVAGDIPRGMA